MHIIHRYSSFVDASVRNLRPPTLCAPVKAIGQMTELFRRSMRGLPISADGLTDAQAAPAMEGKKDKEAFILRIVEGIEDQANALPSLVDAFLHANNSTGIDDRELQQRVENDVIGLFYHALPHPPVNFLPSMLQDTKIPTVINGAAVRPGQESVGRACVPPNHGPAAPGAAPTTTTTGGNPQLATPTPSGFATIPNGNAQWPGAGPSGAHRPDPTTTDPSATKNAGGSNFASEAAAEAARKAYSSQFRTPSGAQNNPHLPLLGAAGTAYARAVPSLHPIPRSTLPDPDMVFDLLMKRTAPPSTNGAPSIDDDSFFAVAADQVKTPPSFRGQGHGQPHPSGLSSLMFGFADLIIHSLFRTSSRDPSVNLTSSYLDLSPLYGVDETEMNTVRRFDGTGRLWEDVWADPRLTMMPPHVCALLVYVSQKLLDINEAGWYKRPAFPPPKANSIGVKQLFAKEFAAGGEDMEIIKKQDDDIFNRARLINCAYFMNAILGDYLSGILGTFREASEWCLNPLEEIRQGGRTVVNRAEGNQVTWHATMPPVDEQWLEDAFKSVLPETHDIHKMAPGHVDLSAADLKMAAMQFAMRQGSIPNKWTFGGLHRNADGGFDDYAVAKILHKATETSACAYGARSIPSVMKAVEVMGIKQARKWGVCTMNEFRQFVGLKKYESFEEWNPTGDIAVGLMCEESKQPTEGAGLCPGYTISRAILADATARGTSRTAQWAECSPNSSSVPFQTTILRDPYTPREMERWLTKMDLKQNYKFAKLPSDPIRPVQAIDTAKGVAFVLNDLKTFSTVYSDGMKALTKGYGFFLAFDDEPRHGNLRSMMRRALYRDGALPKYAEFYGEHTRELIKLRSFQSGPGKRAVNIVRDVINIVPVHWVCEEIAGLPLKSEKAPGGIFTEQEVYNMIACIFTFIFLNHAPENDWPLRTNSLSFADKFLKFIKARLAKVSGGGFSLSVDGIRDSIIHYITHEVDHSDAFYRALLDNNTSKLDLDQLSYNVLGLICASVANFAHDFYLDEKRTTEREHIISLAMDRTPRAELLLMGYTREALRINPQAPGLFRRATQAAEIPGPESITGKPETISVLPGDRIFVSLKNASMDVSSFVMSFGLSVSSQLFQSASFVNPEKVDPARPKERYSSFGRGEHQCLGELFTESMIPAMLRVVFSLKNVKRAADPLGKLSRYGIDQARVERDLLKRLQGRSQSLWYRVAALYFQQGYS
ncbi:15835_t:CDS:10 [Acaulospora colombiana]|uniref:15835_t:CDS:1 n=1 Tax=Acaulospora colombiana TaxID=27376 RepID=A0ACA9L2E0_9GLOM|nr:15835_t:CDS:10 [Acaulospora colombiana]